MTYIVEAPLVCVPDREGHVGYFYQGAVLPPYVGAADARRLLDDGMIAESVESPAQTPEVSEPKSTEPKVAARAPVAAKQTAPRLAD